MLSLGEQQRLGIARALLYAPQYLFLDEATALAAGHRPCAECRRGDFNRFRQAWAQTHPRASLKVDDIDKALHGERIGPGNRKLLHEEGLDDLPEGSMIAEGDQAWLVLGSELLHWSPFGYTNRRTRPRRATVEVLTPPSIIRVMRAGYEPSIRVTARA